MAWDPTRWCSVLATNVGGGVGAIREPEDVPLELCNEAFPWNQSESGVMDIKVNSGE